MFSETHCRATLTMRESGGGPSGEAGGGEHICEKEQEDLSVVVGDKGGVAEDENDLLRKSCARLAICRTMLSLMSAHLLAAPCSAAECKICPSLTGLIARISSLILSKVASSSLGRGGRDEIEAGSSHSEEYRSCRKSNMNMYETTMSSTSLERERRRA